MNFKAPAHKHLRLIYAAIFCVFIIAAAFFIFSFYPNGEGGFEHSKIVIQRADGTQIPFKVELALTDAQHEQGLMHREGLGDKEGMLFVFRAVRHRSFWMKDTLIPLDMVFIGRDGIIRHIHEMAMPLDERSIPSMSPVKAVLEINGGASRKYGIHTGDKVLHSTFEGGR